jgi:hypothetical protein
MTFLTIQELAKAFLEDSVISLKELEVKELLYNPLEPSKLNILAEAAKKNTSVASSLRWEMPYKNHHDIMAFYKALGKLSKLQTFQVDCYAAEDEYVGIIFLIFWYCRPGSRM